MALPETEKRSVALSVGVKLGFGGRGAVNGFVGVEVELYDISDNKLNNLGHVG
jgi:hypothetical protein